MEDPVSFPQIQAVDLLLWDPLQGSLIAVCQFTGEIVRCVEENIFHLIIVIVVHESQNTPESIACERQACFLFRLTQNAVLRALTPLELSADSDPFILIHVMFLLDTVDHQIFVIFFNIA